MTETIIRPMTLADAGAMAGISEKCFTLNWSAQAFRSEAENPIARYLVITSDEEIVAYGGMWMIISSAEITSIAVLPGYRRHGYGEWLMRSLMKLAYEELEITEMSLEVRESNLSAQGLYRKLGFQTEGRRARYYEDNKEDALIMWNHDTRDLFSEDLTG